MDKPKRNAAGRGTGRGSDKNNKPSFSKPGRSSAPRGKDEGKFEKKPYGKSGGTRESFGNKKSGKSDSYRADGRNEGGKSEGRFEKKPYGKSGAARENFGDKKFGKPDSYRADSRNEGGKGKFAGKPAPRGERSGKSYGDKPAGRDGDKKSSYKAYEEKGKRSARSDFDSSRFWKEENETAPKKSKTGKPKAEPIENKAKGHENLDHPKKSGKKPRIKRLKPTADIPEYEKTAFPQAGIRLNKFIANSGLCSRREADVMIQNGVVTVNGKVMDELGYRVQADDVVKFDGRTIIPEKPVYLLLNKPKDYITTSEDPQGRKTVMALIQGACKERLFPVGRLDRNTTGLLLFTNDGEMADKLMHPRKRVRKIYLAELDKNMKHDHLQELRDGITLEDGPIKPDEVEYADDKRTIGVEVHSGRNRIVRRMFEHFGYKVVKLDRTYYAGLTKKNLPRGHYRMLDPMEVNMLKML